MAVATDRQARAALVSQPPKPGGSGGRMGIAFPGGVILRVNADVDGAALRRVFMLYCRATIDTDAPGINDAATFPCLSASGQDRWPRSSRKFVPTIELVGTSG
jgi:hypothetical protein